VVVPSDYRSQILNLVYDNPMSSHLGITKAYNQILHFFWPDLKSDVEEYCHFCHVCQPNQVIPPAPSQPIPVVGEPFERLIVDCVGPIPKSKSCYLSLSTLIYATALFPK